MSNWKERHKVIWLALGNDQLNTLIGVADTYESIKQLGADWSKSTGETHYLRQYAKKIEPSEPELPRVIEINGNLYRMEQTNA